MIRNKASIVVSLNRVVQVSLFEWACVLRLWHIADFQHQPYSENQLYLLRQKTFFSGAQDYQKLLIHHSSPSQPLKHLQFWDYQFTLNFQDFEGQLHTDRIDLLTSRLFFSFAAVEHIQERCQSYLVLSQLSLYLVILWQKYQFSLLLYLDYHHLD